MKRIVTLFIWFFTVLGLYAQTVTLDLPFHPGRAVTLWLKNGTQNDTIFTGNMDANGQAKITVPKQYKNYRGIAALRPEHPGAYFEFIVAGEDMTLHCTEEYPHGGNVTFSGSPENEALQRWFTGQAVRQQKIGLLSELERVYDNARTVGATSGSPDNENSRSPRRVFITEKESLQKEQAAFEKELVGSKLYAARFMELHNFQNREVSPLVFADSTKMAKTRKYVTDSLDVQSLYTSDMWFDVLNGLLALYDNGTPFHYEYVKDMSLLLNRSDDKVYTTLAENLFAICESTGWNDLEEQLAYFLINDGRIKEPTGKLKQLMTLFKLAKESSAPPLSFAGDDFTGDRRVAPTTKTILVFYESGCGPCENEMQQLKENYALLKEKGYEVISVSADTDADVFRNTAESFPWEEKYCDLQGFSGPDFKNYGIIGTPTFYVIDEKGIIQGRYARLADLIN